MRLDAPVEAARQDMKVVIENLVACRQVRQALADAAVRDG